MGFFDSIIQGINVLPQILDSDNECHILDYRSSFVVHTIFANRWFYQNAASTIIGPLQKRLVKHTCLDASS